MASSQLDERLAKIEDRLLTIEAIISHASAKEIQAMIVEGIGTSQTRKNILKHCQTPKTIQELQALSGLNSAQSVNHYLKPLRDHGLVVRASVRPTLTYEWSGVVSRLSKATRDKLLS